MFSTPFWAAVQAGGFTLGGVIASQSFTTWQNAINAKSKEKDRQHERALDYEKRVWELKNDALKVLISACRSVKSQAQQSFPDEENEDDFRCAVVVRALDLFEERLGGEDGISEIAAYSATPVQAALDEMLSLINSQRLLHQSSLRVLRQIGRDMQAAGHRRRLAADDDDLTANELGTEDPSFEMNKQDRAEVLRALMIDHEGTLDVSEVIALCDRVIDVAREDMQGRYTE